MQTKYVHKIQLILLVMSLWNKISLLKVQLLWSSNISVII